VFFFYELCDAVQAETYEIEGVKVSNFLLPLYFTGTRQTDEPGARNDFLGRAYKGQTLRSFGINPGGYVGFFDPQTGKDETYSLRGDAAAAQRYEIKQQTGDAWRATRYADAAARRKLQRKASGSRRVAAARPPLVVTSLTEDSAAAATSVGRPGSSRGSLAAKESGRAKGVALGREPGRAKGVALGREPGRAKGATLARGAGARPSGSGSSRRMR
jgi:hypothetical protein